MWVDYKSIDEEMMIMQVTQKTSNTGVCKDTKKSTVPVRRRKRVTWDPW